MEQHVKKQNSFFQTRMNQAKLGAYYTDPAHCQWIAGLLDFPENEEVCGQIGRASCRERVCLYV